MERDSNPRNPYEFAGFQNRCLKPLSHPSESGLIVEVSERKFNKKSAFGKAGGVVRGGGLRQRRKAGFDCNRSRSERPRSFSLREKADAPKDTASANLLDLSFAISGIVHVPTTIP
jgi:hypothetical protein